VDDAVEAARDAYPGWSGTPVQVRQRLLAEYAKLLRRREIREEVA
jgi:acyl-CoA reductase-like NAD-dependent aldehyde dehydrogenase